MALVRASFPGFPKGALRFFRQLKQNNNRTWFLEHKETFEQQVKLPMIGLVRTLGTELGRLAPEMQVEPSRAIYRIYRDVRFSADKSPYKTQIAASFYPRGIPRHSGAGLYFHISPEEVLIAGGFYIPGAPQLRAIRSRIARRPDRLRRIVQARDFKKLFGSLEGERLSRAPKGYPFEHPAIDLLRYKQFLAVASHPSKAAEGPGLLPLIVSHFRTMMPLVRFLNEALRRAT